MYLHPLPSEQKIETDASQQWSYGDVDRHLCNTFDTTRTWVHEQNKVCEDLRARLEQERASSQQKQTAMARKIEALESKLAAVMRKGRGEQEMEERNAQTHELEDGAAQRSRWWAQGVHVLQEDVLAGEQRPEKAGSTSSLATVFEESCSSTEPVVPLVQELQEAGRRRTKRNRRA
jgi:hypothetical protein